MPRWIIVITVIFTIAASAVVATTLTDTLFTKAHMTPQPRSPAAPTVPPPALPKAEPAPAASVSNIEMDKALGEMRKRLADLEEKLKAVPGAKPDTDTKSQTWGEFFSSWRDFKLPSPSSVGTVPKVATPLPTVPPPPGASPKTKLGEIIAEIERKVAAKPADTESKSVPTVPPPPAAPTLDLKSWVKGVLPTIPSPPSATMAGLKGPSGSWGGFFSGGCKVRSEEITLKVEDDWRELTGKGKDECLVVYDYGNAIIFARDGRGEYQLTKNDAVAGRNPREVKLIAGSGYFRYSTCDRELEGQSLDWKCQPKR